MADIMRYAGQAVFYVCAAALTGYLSFRPLYQQTPPELAQIKLSFAHGAQRVEDCRRLTTKEIAALPPSERRPNTCSRERHPVYVEFSIDGDLLYAQRLEPAGLSKDGPSRTYQKFLVKAGEHTVTARLRDSGRGVGFDYEMEQQLTLAAGQSLAVDFRAEAGGFILK